MSRTNFEKICQFQEAIGSKRPPLPTVPDTKQLLLRLKLIQEEYAESMAAAEPLNNGSTQRADLAKFAHELADLLYVVYGTFAVCGIDADAIFSEIHRANMAKMGGPLRPDGKLLKPQGWQPANVLNILEKMEKMD